VPGGGASPFLGQIMMVGFNFSPRGWAFCDGQLLAISQNDALFALLGTTYGGDGVTTFALPDLRGRTPMHWGNGPGGFNTVIGETLGTEAVTLTVSQIPSHQHVYSPGASQGEQTSNRPDNRYPAVGGYYATTANAGAPMGAPTVAVAGGSQPHNNLQPYLGINFIIALEGIFPTRS
jgi:microcystin-dependent protein